ncbi:MAG: hypothetical protein V3U69_02390 [Bacteroidota bacterium]
MGQQQLILIILAVVIVALAIVGGLVYYKDTAADLNRQAVRKDLEHITSLAKAHYRIPRSVGGGGNTFEGFTIPPTLLKNANGTFLHIKDSHNENHIHFDGIGVEYGEDGVNPIHIEYRIEINEIKISTYN